MLKAPGIKLLKPRYDKPLSNFGFKFNLRHHDMASLLLPSLSGSFSSTLSHLYSRDADEVGRCRLTPG
jgi:hypothetical protein